VFLFLLYQTYSLMLFRGLRNRQENLLNYMRILFLYKPTIICSIVLIFMITASCFNYSSSLSIEGFLQTNHYLQGLRLECVREDIINFGSITLIRSELKYCIELGKLSYILLFAKSNTDNNFKSSN
jgi:hypothetical protein